MKNTLYAWTITLILFPLKSVLGQDPSVYVQIKILLTDTNTTSTHIQDQYHLFIRTENRFKHNTWDRNIGTNMKFNSERQLFEDGYLGAYCKEVIEITITQNTDSMIVRFKQDSLYNPLDQEDCIKVAHFYLEIPFQKGYYEIKNFAWTEKGLTINKNKWSALQVDKRELLINGQ